MNMRYFIAEFNLRDIALSEENHRVSELLDKEAAQLMTRREIFGGYWTGARAYHFEGATVVYGNHNYTICAKSMEVVEKACDQLGVDRSIIKFFQSSPGAIHGENQRNLQELIQS